MREWKPDQEDAPRPLTERRAREFEWARKHLPDQHEGLVVSAMLTLSLGGTRPSTKSVMARLVEQGRAV